MKRTCNNCKALIADCGNSINRCCSLNHKIECIKEYHGVPTEFKPLEECEKPETFKALCRIGIANFKEDREIERE